MDALNNSLFRILWERLMIDDILMQIIPQEITTSRASMSIIDCKESRLYAIFVDIQDNTYPILIVVPRNTHVSIDSVGLYQTVLFG